MEGEGWLQDEAVAVYVFFSGIWLEKVNQIELYQ
jgi:hypothetical protein